MKEKVFTVKSKMGLHARPAAALVHLLQKFESHVRVRRDDQEVDAKSIMGLLTLTAEFGAPLTLLAEGPDEEAVMADLEEFFERRIVEEDMD